MEDSKSVGNGTTSCHCYRIEARLRHPDNPPIRVLEDLTIDGKWRSVSTHKSEFGVPSNLYDAQATQHGYLEHDCAMALAYRVIVAARRAEIEVRLVEYKFISTWSATKEAELEPISTYQWKPKAIPGARGGGQ